MFEVQNQSSLFKKLIRQKRWRYFAINHSDFFFSTALVDLNYSGLIFYSLFDKKTNQFIVDKEVIKLPWETITAGNLPLGEDGFSLFSSRNKYWRFDSGSLGSNNTKASLVLQDKVILKAQWDVKNWYQNSLCVEGALPQHSEFYHGTFKTNAAMIEDGELISPLGRLSLKGALVSMDYSNGILPREVEWFWASGFTKNAGFNLQQGYFGEFENALYFNSAWHKLGPADFMVQDSLWVISSPEDRFYLEFTPIASRRSAKNLFIVKSFYEQPVGFFKGFVRTSQGERYPVDQVFGVTEKHSSKW